MFNISQASEKEIPLIIDIAEKTWWPTYSQIISPEQIRYMLDTIYSPDTLKKHIVDGSQTFLILWEAGEPQGFAAFGMRPGDIGVFKVHKLYVLPARHEKGRGKALLDEIKNRLLQQDIHILDVNVNRFNPARIFYEKRGFKLLREEDVPIGPYWMNDYVLRLEF
jgi:diamine N-acetyltransferase